MSTKVYEYSNCSTCKKALKFLTDKKISFEKIAIVEQPPTIKELKKMLGHLEKAGGSLKNLFNTSGQVYREMEISEKLKAGMSEDEALKLLSQNGKLIKRPFLLTSESGTVGFKEETWKKLF